MLAHCVVLDKNACVAMFLELMSQEKTTPLSPYENI